MTPKHLFLSLLMLGFCCAPSLAQDTAYARSMIAKLCDDDLHGRGYYHDGDQAAAYLIEQEMKQMGLRAYDFDPYQEFKFSVNAFQGVVSLMADSTALTPGVDFLVSEDCPAVRGTFRCDVRDTIAEVDADGNYTGAMFAAATALVLPETALPKGPKRAQFLQSLRVAGAGLLIIITKNKLTWSVAQQQGLMPSFTVLADRWPKSVGYIKVQVDAALIKKHMARNVIGYVEGNEKPNELVVITAHYDHLGRMGKQTIFPGANDNASGTSMLLDMARHYAKEENRPARTMVFMAFAGEEAGLLGSSHFVAHPLFPLAKIKFLINLDLLGTGEEGITVVNGSVHEAEFALLKELDAEFTHLPQIKARGKAANSDHYPFSEAGVPAFFIYAMGPRKAYHDVDDVPSTLTLAGYEGIYRLIQKFVQQLP